MRQIFPIVRAIISLRCENRRIKKQRNGENEIYKSSIFSRDGAGRLRVSARAAWLMSGSEAAGIVCAAVCLTVLGPTVFALFYSLSPVPEGGSFERVYRDVYARSLFARRMLLLRRAFRHFCKTRARGRALYGNRTLCNGRALYNGRTAGRPALRTPAQTGARRKKTYKRHFCKKAKADRGFRFFGLYDVNYESRSCLPPDIMLCL